MSPLLTPSTPSCIRSVRMNATLPHLQHKHNVMEISNVQNNCQIPRPVMYTISHSQDLHNSNIQNNRYTVNTVNSLNSQFHQQRSNIPVTNYSINNNNYNACRPGQIVYNINGSNISSNSLMSQYQHSSQSQPSNSLNVSSYKMYYINVASTPMLILCPDNE